MPVTAPTRAARVEARSPRTADQGADEASGAAPRRVLLIRLSAIGDVLNVLPALTLVRRGLPDAHIGFAVEDRAADVICGHPFVDQAIVFPRRRWRAWLLSPDPRRWARLAREVAAYARRLREARFEVVLDFQGNLKGAVHALASRAARRIGFARGFDREWSHLFTNEHVRPPADRPHRVEKFASLAASLVPDSGRRDYVLPRSAEARDRVDAWLAGCGVADSGPDVRRFVVLHPGTSERGAEKRWPVERFAELARRIASEIGPCPVVTWGPGEEPLSRRVCALAGGKAVLGPATGSLLELAELLRRASLFVSADTGPMHLAAACGTPCVALFGPKDPAVYRPWGEGHAVLRGRTEDGRPAMDRIGVDQVFAAAARALSRA